MKNLLKIGVISALLVGSTYASDLLSSLTNGKISDSSTGVKVLNLDEMKQVKGGINIEQKFHIAYNDAQGNRINYTQYWQLIPTAKEEQLGKLERFDGGGYSASDYQSFKWFTSVDPKNEIVIVMGTYDFKTNTIFVDIAAYNKATKSHRNLRTHPLAQQLLNATKLTVAQYTYNQRFLPIK